MGKRRFTFVVRKNSEKLKKPKKPPSVKEFYQNTAALIRVVNSFCRNPTTGM